MCLYVARDNVRRARNIACIKAGLNLKFDQNVDIFLFLSYFVYKIAS